MTAPTDRWITAAEDALVEGDRSLTADDLAEACRHYLRAAEFYRLAARCVDRGSREWYAWRQAEADVFRAAVPLLPHPATPLATREVPAAGYLFRPVDRPAPWAAAIVMSGDGAATAESLYETTAVSILGLGLACGTFAWTDELAIGGRRDGPDAPASAWWRERLARWVAGQPGIDPARVWLVAG
jgi:hypothetical protein